MRDTSFRSLLWTGVLLAVLSLQTRPLAAQAAAAAAPPPLKVTATLSRTMFQPDIEYDKALVVTVEDQTGTKISGATVTATIEAGEIDFFTTSGSTAANPQTQTTDANGAASFNLKTRKMEEGESDDFAIRVAASPPAGMNAGDGKDFVQGDIGSGFDDSFRSDRVSSEVFVGGTFARAYDENGKSEGFDETSMAGIFRVDTLYRPKGQHLHTGLEIMFSSFPKASNGTDTGGTGGSGNGGDDDFEAFSDAYTGSVIMTLQPRRMASYSDTAINEDGRLRYDAFRHGFTARLSVTSREEKKASNMDTDIFHGRIGYLFTHHQTEAGKPELDGVNVFPMRFVEVAFGYYESIFDRRDEPRFILEAGLRLPGLGNDAVPFYGGIFLNAGRGQDDFRVFAGLLFRLDRVPRFFR